MNAFGAIFLLLAGLLQLGLPRRWAAVPLLLGAASMTRAQDVDIGGAHFTVMHWLVLIGAVRVALRGERLAQGWRAVDRCLVAWAVLLLLSSAMHTSDAWLLRTGVIWTELGCYLLLRVFLQDIDAVRDTLRFMCLAVLPLAVFMLIEKTTRDNLYALLGGVPAQAIVRDGKVRAGGPFDHPILAGTVGAASLAWALALGRADPWRALAGSSAGLAILFAATSSGPLVMAGFVVLGRWIWCLRHHMRALRLALLGSLLGLSAVMNDPVYFLMARIDLTGSSQGYFRAQLIRSALEHLPEWWLAGTDYTRHWMATGIPGNSHHTDMTNHLLAMGVNGGIGLIAMFVVVIVWSFGDVGRALRLHATSPPDRQILVWMLGALLFAYLMMFWTISLYDYSVVFLYLVPAAIQALHAPARAAAQAGPPARRLPPAYLLRTG